ncbi:hypothetical protein N0V90_009083 [Kalmusia sp. IMI 367209]|nr:hypothetical protein N0V90_009083 [Kalmusia sp. IMI 367209]
MLCISARHLAFLNPANSTYYSAIASTHLHHALSGFRAGIQEQGVSVKNVDVFMMTALLLQFELWIDVDNLHKEYDPAKDSIFAYSASLKATLLECFEPGDVQYSTVMTHLTRDEIVAGNDGMSAAELAEYRAYFDTAQDLTVDKLSLPVISQSGTPHNLSDPTDNAKSEDLSPYSSVIERLAYLLVVLPSTSMDSAPTSLKIARRILCFPILCRGAFATKVACSDPHALLILYHFFRATRILLDGDDFWWAKKRAGVVEDALERWLRKRCVNSKAV